MRFQALWAIILLAATAPLARGNDSAATQPFRIIVEVRMLGSREPVAAANVTWKIEGDITGSAQTNAAGACVIDGVSSGCKWMIVRVKHEDMVPLAIYWDRTIAAKSSTPATLPKCFFLMEKGSRISGHVVDESGKPVAGAKVFIGVGKKYEGTIQSVDLSWHSAITDSNGLWFFTGVPLDPDRMEVGLYDLMHLSSDYFNLEDFKPRAALWDGTARLTLPAAKPVQVTVLKPDGTPAVGAEVFFGSDIQVANCFAPAKTDAQGKAAFGFKSGTSGALTASLPGYGPAQQIISVATQPSQLTLKLTNTGERTIELVDPNGKPVHGATIIMSKWHGMRVLDAQWKTDDMGRAVWKDGPADDVTVNIFANGFAGKDEFTWSAGKVTRVALTPPTTVTGHVIDAATGEQIQTYTIRVSTVWNQGDRPVWQAYDWSPITTATREKGKFVLTLTDPCYRYLLRVQADGCLPQDSPLFDPDGSAKNFEFRLQHGEPVTGRIVTAQDRPVAGADVYLVTSGDWLGLLNGNVRDDFSKACASVKSGDDGRFILPPQKEDFALLVSSDSGSATLLRDEMVAKNPDIRLSPWAVVRGTIKVNGKPAAGIDVSGNADSTTFADGTQAVGRQYDFKTDMDGKFELPRVAGRLMLTRQIPNYAPRRSWYISIGSIDAAPGKTYDVTFGEGASVTGQLLIPPGKPWMVRQARLEPKGRPHVENWENVQVMPDGRFRAEGMSPGNYVLHIALHEFPPGDDCGWGRVVGEYDKNVTIDDAGKELDIGTLTSKPIAPDFTVKTLDGKTVRLADLKGKVVVLDFWAGWCAPCVAEMPNLQKIAAANAGNENFALVQLSLDDKQEDTRLFLKRAEIHSPQEAWVGMDSEVVNAYGATAIPATFLIGPDGKIIDRDLRGQDLNNAVNAAMAQR